MPELVERLRAGEREFEQETFAGADLGGLDVDGCLFIDCRFEGCNLLGFQPARATLRNVRFRDCRLTGVDWRGVTAIGLAVGFERCELSYGVFDELPLARTAFTDCKVLEASFAGTELARVTFPGCDLTGCVFDGADLTRADLATARGYVIDPERTRVAGARFSIEAALALVRAKGIEVAG